MVPHNQGSLLWHFRLTNETYLISGQLNNISSFRGDKYYDEMAPVKKVPTKKTLKICCNNTLDLKYARLHSSYMGIFQVQGS
jgi:hypothetical protein